MLADTLLAATEVTTTLIAAVVLETTDRLILTSVQGTDIPEGWLVQRQHGVQHEAGARACPRRGSLLFEGAHVPKALLDGCLELRRGSLVKVGGLIRLGCHDLRGSALLWKLVRHACFASRQLCI